MVSDMQTKEFIYAATLNIFFYMKILHAQSLGNSYVINKIFLFIYLLNQHSMVTLLIMPLKDPYLYNQIYKLFLILRNITIIF